jgi:hypothetical protein
MLIYFINMWTGPWNFEQVSKYTVKRVKGKHFHPLPPSRLTTHEVHEGLLCRIDKYDFAFWFTASFWSYLRSYDSGTKFLPTSSPSQPNPNLVRFWNHSETRSDQSLKETCRLSASCRRPWSFTTSSIKRYISTRSWAISIHRTCFPKNNLTY